MVFSSVVFLFLFLPVTLFLYYICKPEYQNILLLLTSLLFYAYGEPKFVIVMLLSIVCNYVFALWMQQTSQRRFVLLVSISFNVAVFFVFKYLGFAMDIFNRVSGLNIEIAQIALPIGISFFTFQEISYLIDVYRGTTPPQKDICKLGLYVSLFPQLIAGPIVRYNTVAAQIDKRTLSAEAFGEGVKRFTRGLCKKMLLANNLANVSKVYFMEPVGTLSVAGAWLGAICFSLQIYYDFAGYSDMAIGLGKILGFEFEENFDYPYISKSVTEFWKRWHISLGKWFRDYVYIPLGGSKVSTARHIANLAIVWLLTGIWHGANYPFILWGMMYFFALVFEKYIIKPTQKTSKAFVWIYRIAVLAYINFAWVIFNANSLGQGIKYCIIMLGGLQNVLYDATFLWYLREYWAFIVVGLIFSAPVCSVIASKIESNKLQMFKKILTPLVYSIGFLWSVSYMILGAHNPFIYFNF